VVLHRSRKEKIVPKLLYARASQGTEETRKIRKLAGSRHAPADWKMRAQMIALSWDGLRTTQIASELRCHPQTVRERIHRFNEEGLDGLGDRPGAGRKRRITETERSLIISLVGTDPPGRLVRGAGGELEASDEEREAHWTLDAITTAARERGIAVGRSQVRRILLIEGVRWRNLHPWGESQDPEFVPKGQESSLSTSRRPRMPRPSAWMN